MTLKLRLNYLQCSEWNWHHWPVYIVKGIILFAGTYWVSVVKTRWSPKMWKLEILLEYSLSQNENCEAVNAHCDFNKRVFFYFTNDEKKARNKYFFNWHCLTSIHSFTMLIDWSIAFCCLMLISVLLAILVFIEGGGRSVDMLVNQQIHLS